MAINNEFDRSSNREVISENLTSEDLRTATFNAGTQEFHNNPQVEAATPEVVRVAQANTPAAPERVVVEIGEGKLRVSRLEPTSARCGRTEPISNSSSRTVRLS